MFLKQQVALQNWVQLTLPEWWYNWKWYNLPHWFQSELSSFHDEIWFGFWRKDHDPRPLRVVRAKRTGYVGKDGQYHQIDDIFGIRDMDDPDRTALMFKRF